MGRVRSNIKNVARALCVGASTGAGMVYLFGAGAGTGTVSIQFLVVGVVFSKGAGVDFELKLL